jgi:predicted Zn finger-like uncharacterized protein
MRTEVGPTLAQGRTGPERPPVADVIVTCEQCRTQFRLDDSKIPEMGARVRCSKCKHAFFIEWPGQGDGRLAEQLAREAATGADADESESDWEFNHDAPLSAERASPEAPAPGLEAAREAVDDLLGPILEPEPPAAPGTSLEAPEPVAPEPEPEPEPEPAAPAVSEPADLAGAVSEDATPEPEAPSPGADLGSPEDWNFFEEGDRAAEGAAIRMSVLKMRWPILQEKPQEQPEEEAARGPLEDLESSAVMPPALGRAGNICGWIAALTLLAVGLYGGLAPRPIGSAPGPQAVEVAGLMAEGVVGHWVENAAAALAVRLLDADGAPVGAAPTPVGPRFSEYALRELDPDELLTAQARAAPEFARLHPGETVGFHAIFAAIPPAAARFELERTALAP